MRKDCYDVMVKEALERINDLPKEKVTEKIQKIKEALEIVATETDTDKLLGYYERMDEFYSVNAGKGLEYMDGDYLLRGV